MFPVEDVGATRMQDEAGHAPADRRWSRRQVWRARWSASDPGGHRTHRL